MTYRCYLRHGTSSIVPAFAWYRWRGSTGMLSSKIIANRYVIIATRYVHGCLCFCAKQQATYKHLRSVGSQSCLKWQRRPGHQLGSWWGVKILKNTQTKLTGMTQVVVQLVMTEVICYLSRDVDVGTFHQFRNCRSLNHPFLYKLCACKSVTNIILIIGAWTNASTRATC